MNRESRKRKATIKLIGKEGGTGRGSVEGCLETEATDTIDMIRRRPATQPGLAQAEPVQIAVSSETGMGAKTVAITGARRRRGAR